MSRYSEERRKRYNRETYKDYPDSKGRFQQRQHEDTERRQKINPRLLVLDKDFFDRLMEQNEP